MSDIASQLNTVRQRITNAARVAGRNEAAISLLAVSKTFSAAMIRAAYAAGQLSFGENYMQEALEKIEALADLRAQLEWHFIGPLQSNKTKWAAAHFDWVHSVDRLKLAQRLSEQRPTHLPPLNICLQVNLSGEASKSGIAPANAVSLAQALATLPRLKLRGLMAIPAPADTLDAQRLAYRQLSQLLNTLRTHGLALDTLSAGMSADLEAALLEGATLVRIGSAIFGTRARH
ncbi:YggS family pyridoxal phosphate-dependent enzyme [Mycoavidus sp. B2-EB]|uniref:YggS family pyridoxal phosphate-dependent enzyme n=1 Tax=Mycoavidus sp. B2-EB TaxID=2651972 RepID=UPI00162344CA|nr:YggS family pyridoxal phosphate-dependent enzyme [Mycoavidus sp. B2-EB]BBO58992.1 YggS family pyridoxal phosphate enzyme [Mycoavidus sp. B2-EB]